MYLGYLELYMIQKKAAFRAWHIPNPGGQVAEQSYPLQANKFKLLDIVDLWQLHSSTSWHVERLWMIYDLALELTTLPSKISVIAASMNLKKGLG